MLTKVLFTALCAHLSVFLFVFSIQQAFFWGGGGGGGGNWSFCSDQNNMKIKGK